MMTPEEYAKEYYQLEKSGITSVSIKSAIKFAQRYFEYASQFKTVEPETCKCGSIDVTTRYGIDQCIDCGKPV